MDNADVVSEKKESTEPDFTQQILDGLACLYYLRFECGNTIEIFYDGTVKISGGEAGFVVTDKKVLIINNIALTLIDGLMGESALLKKELRGLKDGIFINNFAAISMCEPSQRAPQGDCSDLGELQSWMAK